MHELHSQLPCTLQDKLVAFQKFATMYIRYTLAFRKLEECYDQVVHPQKRRLIRHVLDGTIGRYQDDVMMTSCGGVERSLVPSLHCQLFLHVGKN